MIGNDVVDLILANKESNWKRKGYLDKIFSEFEKNLIKNSSNQNEMVWILWSVKESAYKAYQRITFNEGFYPLKIEINSLSTINGVYWSKIKLFDTYFFGQSIIIDQIINTIVLKNSYDFKNIISLNTIKYKKDVNGLPLDIISNKPISVSHHGRSKVIIGLSK